MQIKNHVEVVDNIAEKGHVQYLVEACKNSEDGFDQHGMDLGKYFQADATVFFWEEKMNLLQIFQKNFFSYFFHSRPIGRIFTTRKRNIFTGMCRSFCPREGGRGKGWESGVYPSMHLGRAVFQHAPG